jgi:type II secretory pathway pseudopilin PulG
MKLHVVFTIPCRFPGPCLRSAFSLVEVTLAIGIVSFALLAVVGLLPVGLKTVKNANEQAGAANAINALARAMRDATPAGSSILIAFAGATNSVTENSTLLWTNLTLEGTQDSANRRLSARLDLLALPTSTNAGRGVVSVAWSAMGNPQWLSNSQTWTNAEGSLTSGVQFLRRQ